MARRIISDLNASVWGFVAFTGISFGAGGLLVKKLTNDGIDAFTVTWVPFLFGGLIALIHGMVTKELRWSSVPAGILLGLFSSLGPSLIFNVGFDRLPAGINTLLISLGPIFTAIVAHFVFRLSSVKQMLCFRCFNAFYTFQTNCNIASHTIMQARVESSLSVFLFQ